MFEKNTKSREILEIALYVFIGYLIAVGANWGLSYALGTDYPVVAVVSSSMEHQNSETYKDWFIDRNFTEQDLRHWSFDDGMRKGDIVAVKSIDFENIEVGDVIVYKFPSKEPIIHRVVSISEQGLYTKGDNNRHMDQEGGIAPLIKEENVKGKAIFHIPLLGYVKILYMGITGR